MLYALDRDELKQLQTADWSAEFPGAEMVAAVFRTDASVLSTILPRPLRSPENPLALAFVAKYPETSFDYVPRLVAEPVVLRPRPDVRCGAGTVKLTSSPYDPLGEVPIRELIVCAYGRFDNAMLPGKVVGRAWWLPGFSKHAFFKVDVAPVKLGSVDGATLSASAEAKSSYIEGKS